MADIDGFPGSYYCPLTRDVMTDPVSDNEGNSYERYAIEHWLSTSQTSPVTRNPLRPQDLRENRALRQAITDALEARRRNAPDAPPVARQTAQFPPLAGMRVSDSEDLQFLISSSTGSNGEYFIQLMASPPEGRQRTPSDVCCVVDISGSMGGEATLATATGTKESHGLSLLDIVKHAVRTVVHSLNQYDRLSVVAYSTAARVLFPLTVMDEAGKQEAERRLATLNPEDTTNIWDGLQQGIEQLKAPGAAGRMSAVLLLTDGLPNVEPPRGTLPQLKRHKENMDGKVLPCATIATFGFGYSLDSALLEGIAKEGNGMYAFIPDASFVGTAFVNSVSNLLTTFAKDVHLILEPMVGVEIDASEVGFPVNQENGKVEICSGTIHYGQPKSSVIRVKGPPGSTAAQLVRATIRYETSNGVKTVTATPAMRDDFQTIQMNRLRQLCVMTVLNSIAQMKGSDVDGAQAAIRNFIQTVRSSTQVLNQEWTQGLLQDLEGQVTAAFSRKDWFQKWGVHYLPSLARAHLLQQCNNFKDPGVQLYGGKLFRQLRDESDDIFCKLAPPTPSIVPRASSVSAAAPAPRPIQSMAVYNNADNPCFSGSSSVAMGDGTAKMVADLVKGDIISTGRGGMARVACIVRTVCAGWRTRLVRLASGALEITPWHPVLAQDGVWRFPCELGEVEELPCEAVYSIALESDCAAALDGADHIENGGVMIGGYACATLGHGMSDESRLVEAAGWSGYTTVLGHGYFGTAAVIRDLSSLAGWAEGYIQFAAGCMERDVETGILTGFRTEAAVPTC